MFGCTPYFLHDEISSATDFTSFTAFHPFFGASTTA